MSYDTTHAQTETLQWVQATAHAPWSARGYHAAVGFGCKAWILSGYDGSRLPDVWQSEDGAAWTMATGQAPWPARTDHAAVAYDGRMWVLGGEVTVGASGGVASDVWYSTDGASWIAATAAAPWSAREKHTVAAFDGRLWVMGGGTGNGANDHNDVWFSPDGAAWTMATERAGWAARNALTSLSAGGRLWIFGGSDRSDVWYATDGASWSAAADPAPWPGRSHHAAAVFDERMWVMGGRGGGGTLADVWSSGDGVNWTAHPPAGGMWSARWDLAAAVVGSRLYILGGNADSIGLANDVWFVESGVGGPCGCDPPVITIQPSAKTLCEGGVATLAIAADGTAPAFQWRLGGVGIPGATGEMFVLNSTTTDEGGMYDVVVRNACGTIVSDAAPVIVWPIGTADVNGDGRRDGLDIGGFAETILAPQPLPPELASCAADLNGDGVIDAADVSAFVRRLLGE